MPTVPTVDRRELRRLIEERDAQVVDVLPPAEFSALHLPGAVSLPLKSLDPDSVAELDRDRPVVVYCSGHT
ncbi:MAG: rhodanese-like domain-containing protein [Actinobacteria bacterium]|nr:rhodanese-like domain-containing protein [Actinomycetota bacterium]